MIAAKAFGNKLIQPLLNTKVNNENIENNDTDDENISLLSFPGLVLDPDTGHMVPPPLPYSPPYNLQYKSSIRRTTDRRNANCEHSLDTIYENGLNYENELEQNEYGNNPYGSNGTISIDANNQRKKCCPICILM